MFNEDATEVIEALLNVRGDITSKDLPFVHAQVAANYRDEHPGVRYEWWTEKTGPGRSEIVWRLSKEIP
jgi:hypothetical protein